MKDATLIYNPRAGQLNGLAKVEPAAEVWRAAGWRVTLEPTRRPGHATELARAAAEGGASVVLAAGGDGTLGQVADGLAGSATALAPLPMGTANALARELRLPRLQLFDPNAPVEAAAALLGGRVQAVDLNYVQTRGWAGHVLLWAGIGADGYLVQQLEPRPTWSKRLGPVGYSIQALTVLHRLPAMNAVVKVDNQTVEGDWLLIVISNCRLYAGGWLQLSGDAVFDDGYFEVWLFRAGEFSTRLTPTRVGLMARYFTGVTLNLQEWDPGVLNLVGKRVVVETRPRMPCQRDGETAGHTPLTCEIRPRSLRLLVPQAAPKALFGQRGTPLAELHP